MPSSEVILIEDPSICAKAAKAYAQAAQDTTALAAQAVVQVVRAGDRYVVWPISKPLMGGEFTFWAIFRADWTLVKTLAS